MRTLVIGDIHGCLNALEALLDYVSPQEDDVVVTVGDYIDRGPDSKGVIDFLNKYRESNQIITLKGNHEQMMEHARDSEQEYYFWLVNGGDATLDSFGTNRLDNIDRSYWKFMADCPTQPQNRTKLHNFEIAVHSLAKAKFRGKINATVIRAADVQGIVACGR